MVFNKATMVYAVDIFEYHTQIRAVSYVLIMLFYLVWGVYSLFMGLYHRAAIKLLTSAVLFSAMQYAMTGNPLIPIYLTTPITVALAVAVGTFVIRLFWSLR